MKRFFSLSSAVLTAVFVLASAVPSASAVGSSGLSITPKKNYIIKPGETASDKLTVGNLDGKADLILSLRMIDFTFTDQSGTPKLSLADNAPLTTWSLKPFTTLPKTLIVPAGQSKTVSYSITIPKSQGAGSYYSAILYQASGGQGSNVGLNASGVTLVFASVPGTVNETMTLQKLGAYNSGNNGETGSYVYIAMNGAPNMMAYALKNQGNVTENPAGNFVLKDTFGHQVANIAANKTSSLALIGQTRLFNACIKTKQQDIQAQGGTTKDVTCVDPHLAPGRYSINLDVFYGQNGNQTHEITGVAHFWYLPFWFLALVALLIALLAYGFFWLKRKINAVVKGTSYRVGGRRH